MIPGLDEIFSLIDVRTHVESGAYDMLVVDCAPTAETLRLLSLPEIMNWYIERIFPVERRVVKTIRPIVSRMTSLPIAGDQVFAAVERLHRNLDAVKQILTDEKVSSVRLVVNPEKMVIAEARRTYTYLGLFGYRVDAVVVNRIIPEEVIDPYFGKWKDIQAEHLATVHESFEPVPILTARLFDREMVGIPLLVEMGDEVYGELEATDILYQDDPISVRKRGTGYVLSMRLPFVSRDEMDIHRRGEELFIRVGSYKRNLILPQTLKRMVVREANFAGDHLEILFGRVPVRRATSRSEELRPWSRRRTRRTRPLRRTSRSTSRARRARAGTSPRRPRARRQGSGGRRGTRLQRGVLSDRPGADRRAAAEARRRRAPPARRPGVLPGGQGADGRPADDLSKDGGSPTFEKIDIG